MRSACIDIGSNTTRVLVAERTDAGLREILSQRVFTRLRRHEGAIPAEKVAELAATVAAQARVAREAGAGRVRVVATAAIRGAANRDELCAAVHAAAGLPVYVLSGEDEARLAFSGAVSTLSTGPAGTVAVVDVGGGSSELVFGTAAGGVESSESLAVGSGVLADRHIRTDPPGTDDLDRIRAEVAAAFAGLEAPAVHAAYAVGGSATSLRRLVGPMLDCHALARACAVVCAEPSAAVARRFDLHPERVHVLPAGLLLLEAASELLGLPLQIAGGGLREGVILEDLDASSA